MKQSGIMLYVSSGMLAVAGLCLSLFAVTEPVLGQIGRTVMVLSVVLFILSAVLWPKFAKSRVSAGVPGMSPEKDVPVCGFSDVAANEEALESLRGLVDYIKDPEKYTRYGARMPRGVLLYGPPGTGKTLLARALAGEAKVPFFALSGSDFVQMYVGVGASRVREIFQKARKTGKCVIFIDEIDAMGKRRDQNSSDERDQTLNALLSEMSGFRPSDGVIVLAATNRLDTLDPALLRPGRFDRQIEVGLPGWKERLSILKLHAKNKPISKEVDLSSLARSTICFSGASLENLLNEAAISAANRNADVILPSDVHAAYIKTVAGADKPSTASKKERAMVALHEAGHAVANRLLLPKNRFVRVSILPAGGGMAGYNLTVPEEKAMLSRKDVEATVQVLLAGRAAEVLVAGEDEVTVGASNDLKRAGELVYKLVTEFGMAGEPAVSLQAINCANTAEASLLCRKKLADLFDQVIRLLEANAEKLSAVMEALLEKESLNGEAVENLLSGNVERFSENDS